VVLVLSAYKAITWALTVDAGVNLQQVIVNGYSDQTVTGLPGGATLLDKNGTGNYWVASARAWPSASATTLVTAAQTQTGLALTTFTGTYESTSYTLSDSP